MREAANGVANLLAALGEGKQVMPESVVRVWLRERWTLGVFLAIGLLLRLVMLWRFRVNSDEPQHLHVVWAWTQGLLPYRDVFDNHMPLFHVLSVPALLVVGERPTAVLWMRVLMLPLWGAGMLMTAVIGRALFSPRVGAWSAVLAGLFPLFFLCSLEYRPDVLWTVLWLGAIALAVGGPLTPARGAAFGLVLGTAVAVSLKTTLMVLAVAIATTVVLALTPRGRREWRCVMRSGLAAGASMLLVPGLVTAYFAAHGALGPFLYGTVWHNLTPGIGAARPTYLALLAAVFAPIAARAIMKLGPAPARRRAFLLLVTLAYLGLVCVWPIVTRQDMLPVIPLGSIVAVAALSAFEVSARWRPGGVLALLVVVELGLLLGSRSVRLDEAHAASALEAEVLHLVGSGEPVLDPKGNTVFRPRPIYWVLETITRVRLKRGLITDDFPGRLVRTHTCVVAGNAQDLPRRTRSFVHEHYLRVAAHPPAGSLRVAGARFDPVHAGFDIAIPAVYTLVGSSGVVHGVLDDRPYDGPRALAPGFHSYRAAGDEGTVALLWAPAAAAFSPFDAAGNWR